MEEMRQSEKIAKEFAMAHISSSLKDLHSLHTLADFLGLSLLYLDTI
jgi:hypothetical protein